MSVNRFRSGSVGVIELNRPDKFNCLSSDLMSEIGAALAEFEADPNVRSILLCAAGKNFCTGADLDEVERTRDDKAGLNRFIRCGNAALASLEESPLPVVVAVQGLCLAGGLELMMAVDVCFAAADARFGDQHARYGLVPGWGGSQRLPRLVGLRNALDILYSARWLSAEEARTVGLVNHVAEPAALRAAALDYCGTLGTRSPAGLARMKRLARNGINMSLAEAIEMERLAVVPHLYGADTAEGLDAFRSRREPRFSWEPDR